VPKGSTLSIKDKEAGPNSVNIGGSTGSVLSFYHSVQMTSKREHRPSLQFKTKSGPKWSFNEGGLLTCMV
jgi:hypothetical protein